MKKEIEEGRITTAQEYRDRVSSQPQEEELKLPSGLVVQVKKLGPLGLALVVRGIKSIPAEDRVKMDPDAWTDAILNCRDEIAEAVIPDVVMEPPIISSNTKDPGPDELRVNELTEGDKYAIINHLNTEAAGAEGAAIADSFPVKPSGTEPGVPLEGDGDKTE